jgi:UDP-N-acetylmuramoyl-tripeptide--D-alanyl-D-alanine ligase
MPGWYGPTNFGRVRFRASDVAAATGGRLVGADADLDGVSFDSRTQRPGQLFVALVAERDGHEFIPAAIAAGAPAYLTKHDPSRAGTAPASAIVVPDTAAALMVLGRWARDRLPDRVAGITGSVGKTSAKDVAAAILRTRWRTAASLRSYNNEQGLPVTLLGAPDDTEVVVLEMGMRGAGEIARLCEVGRPTLGVVTAVAEAHTELLGGLTAVARAKGELIEALPSAGVAVLNADQPLVAAMAERTSARVLTFGTSAADVAVRDLTLDSEARARFMIETPWGSAPIALAVPGAHMALNAAAALAVGLVWDVSLEDAAAAIEGARVSPWRMELHRAASGAVVLNDAYNANPASMRAALDTLAAVNARRRLALLGLMAELDDPAPEHAAIASYARDRGIELVAVGTDLYGASPVDDPLTVVGPLREGDAVLVKASRVAGLERLAARLLEDGLQDA